MNAFRNTFANRHVVLPVIHAEGEEQVLRNCQIAREHGCDGVFLINHAVSHSVLMDLHATAVGRFPGWWVGVNSLGASPVEMVSQLIDDVQGLWTDNAEIEETSVRQPFAQHFVDARRENGWHGLYFGGVAFKYQRSVEDVAAAAQIATRYMDVVTTSGPGTGKAADVEKIRRMKKAIGEFPLAIASGITPENVSEYKRVADCFLVATGISTSFTELDPNHVQSLVSAVRS